MNNNMKRLMKGAIVFQILTSAIFAKELLEPGRWTQSNKIKLEKLIENNKSKENYVVFDWDYTSIYQDTQENLFRYQIDNLKFKMTPEEFKIEIGRAHV